MRSKKQVKRDLNHVNHMIKYGNLATAKYNKYKNGRWKEDVESIESLLAFYLIQVGDRLSKQHLSTEVREQFNFSRKDFRDGIRNMLTHQYGTIVPGEVFEAVDSELPTIMNDLLSIRNNLTKEMDEIEHNPNRETQSEKNRTKDKEDNFFIDR